MKKKKKRKQRGKFLIRSGLFLIAAALLLCVYNIYDGYRAGKTTQEAASFLEAEIIEGAGGAANAHAYSPAFTQDAVRYTNTPVPVLVPDASGTSGPTETVSYSKTAAPAKTSFPAGTAAPSTLPVSNIPTAAPTPVPSLAPGEIEIPDYILNPNMKMPTKRYNKQDYIGILEIPALRLKLSVISEWSYPRLKIAPCRYVGSAYTNDLIICAHNYSSHFGNISKLYEGALVRFTDIDGNVFNYRVAYNETLNPTAVRYMKDSDWDLTLFTCTPGGSYRVTVRCELIRT